MKKLIAALIAGLFATAAFAQASAPAAAPAASTAAAKPARLPTEDEIREALAMQGLNLTITRAVGRGERELLVPTPDNTAEPRNRRVEIIVR